MQEKADAAKAIKEECEADLAEVRGPGCIHTIVDTRDLGGVGLAAKANKEECKADLAEVHRAGCIFADRESNLGEHAGWAAGLHVVKLRGADSQAMDSAQERVAPNGFAQSN